MYNNVKEVPGIVHSITLSTVEILKAQNFIHKVLKVKTSERHHKIDSVQEEKRWFTGIGGELALEKFLDKKFVDLSIGRSHMYNKPDLRTLGLKVGIKCTEYGKHHVIFKDCHEPEIIIFRNIFTFDIIGLATTEVLRANQNDAFILSPALRARRVKTGFCGYEFLKKFSNLKELKGLVE